MTWLVILGRQLTKKASIEKKKEKKDELIKYRV